MKKNLRKHEPRTLNLKQLQLARGGTGGILIVEPTFDARADKRKQSLYFPE